jgi:hypothetical protein
VTRRTRHKASYSWQHKWRIITYWWWKWHVSSQNTGGDPTFAALEREHEEATKVKNI